MHRPTLEDVARAAGVSRATVSRVVRGDVGTATRTIERVERAVRELGYVPNSAARVLASGRPNTIAIVVPEPDERIFSDPFFGLATSGVSERISGTDMQLVMAFAPTSGRPTATIQFLLAGGVAGVIVMSHHRSDGLTRAALELPLPTVFLGAPLLNGDSEPARAHVVDTDNEHGGRIAGDRLAEVGVRNPATITGPMDMHAAVARLDGWREAMGQAGLSFSTFEGDFTEESGRLGVATLLDRDPGIDGIFAASDLMAVGAFKELERRGITPGREVRLIGFDDFAAADALGLTTVRNPAVDLGRQAVAMLTELITTGEAEESRVLPVELVVRETA
ncbi:LacI family DNA-binding transcriptional regulator [Tessaracoccus oleiagri]|uniref:Transcriptional regulator, LacI family n=1 Tax=Tessaracoccus oleiagri TaxID=686624 RepID=A0A1G9H7G5_9ACTN|nr:LacI family DNA-binding transcriptional regulator [Tessaracoccus oleiagri]SDL08891.1 transcriptional regulator, LacI family [Tessaracoccus oleiagri]